VSNMRPRWRKVLHDLWDNKARTLLVVFSIAVGVFSIGVIAGAYQIISNDMGISYAANNPSNIELRTENFDQDVLDNIRNMRGVEDAEARRVINFRARTIDSNAWVSLDVIAFKNFKDNKVNLLKPVAGASEAKKDEILLDKRALEKFDFEIGDYLILELPDGTSKQLRIAGIVQDSSSSAGDFLAPSLGFISMKTMPTLRQPDDLFNRAYITLSSGVDDSDYIHEAGADIKDKLERNGTDVVRTRFSEKHKYPLADIITAILSIFAGAWHPDRFPFKFLDRQYTRRAVKSALAPYWCDQTGGRPRQAGLCHVHRAHHGVQFTCPAGCRSFRWMGRIPPG
jgi:putative ABC transport system permease protein